MLLNASKTVKEIVYLASLPSSLVLKDFIALLKTKESVLLNFKAP